MTGHLNNKILIVTYPNQGHINPSLRLANRLVELGVDVTYSTSISVIRRIKDETTNNRITFAPFSDGHDDGQKPTTTFQQFYADFTSHGVTAVAKIISSAAAAGQPFDNLVYTILLAWAAKVADAHSLKSTLLWCQPATVFDIYYYHFNGYEEIRSCNTDDPTFPVNLPGLPSLTTADLPSFILPSCPKDLEFVTKFLNDHIDVLKITSTPKILVNTFAELELEPLKAIEKLVMYPVGPLVPSNNLLSCNLFEKSGEDYIKWLNMKPKLSVVYVAFGSLATLSIEQVEEVAYGLIESGRAFLWVMREVEQTEKLSKIEALKQQGMIVSWCSQVEVLNHQAIGCFLMHGGWNSTLEALVAGVPIIAFSQWADQATNTKMIQDVWKIGVKVKTKEADGLVEAKEVKRCVEMVMEDEGIRRNAEKWGTLARQALDDGGSSAINLQNFLDDA